MNPQLLATLSATFRISDFCTSTLVFLQIGSDTSFLAFWTDNSHLVNSQTTLCTLSALFLKNYAFSEISFFPELGKFQENFKKRALDVTTQYWSILHHSSDTQAGHSMPPPFPDFSEHANMNFGDFVFFWIRKIPGKSQKTSFWCRGKSIGAVSSTLHHSSNCPHPRLAWLVIGRIFLTEKFPGIIQEMHFTTNVTLHGIRIHYKANVMH